MEIWTLAYDDKANGTGCELFATEREANVSLIERVTEEDTEERTEAMRLLDSEDEEDDLWDYLQENCFGMLDTYNIDSQEIEVPPQPITVFNDRELNTILHALRKMVDPTNCTYCCDHFDEVEPLNEDEIDALCERLQLAPEKPQENTLAGTALRNAEVFIGEELERRQQSGLPSDDPYLAEAHQAFDLITAALGGQL